MIPIERFYPCLQKTSAVWITRTPETKLLTIPHVNVHELPAHGTLRAVLNLGFVRIVDDELAHTDLAKIALFACSGLTEVIPCFGATTGTSDARFSLHLDHLSIRNKGRLRKHYRARRNRKIIQN